MIRWLKKKQRSVPEAFMKRAARWDPFEIKRYESLYRTLLKKQVKADPCKLGLRLLVLSDTHGALASDRNRLPAFLDTVEEFDLCLLLGDLHPAEMPIILDCIPCDKIIAIKGNHDPHDLYSNVGIRDISGSFFDYRGVRFVGLDGSFRYKKERFPSHSQYESLKLARDLPDADVFLTHDVMLSDFDRDPAHSGLIGITAYIYQRGVRWHLHGHIHKSYQKQYENQTIEKSVYLWEYIEI